MTLISDERLLLVESEGDVLEAYRGTPIETVLMSHNLGKVGPPRSGPEVVVATCMDHRIWLKLPEEFAFVIRSAGAIIDPLVFNIACALAIRDIKAVAVIGHSDCAMVDVRRHRDQVMETLTKIGTLTEAEAHHLFEQGAEQFGIDDAIARTQAQCETLQKMFPELLIAPLYYIVADGKLRQIVGG